MRYFLQIKPNVRAIAKRLYGEVRVAPDRRGSVHASYQIQRWLCWQNAPFTDAAALLLLPDHYIFRMLYSHGIALESLGIGGASAPGVSVAESHRRAWRILAANWHLFLGTPSRMWLTQSMHDVFGIAEKLSVESADRIYDQISDCLQRPAFRPRALFEGFNIEILATTESPTDRRFSNT